MAKVTFGFLICLTGVVVAEIEAEIAVVALAGTKTGARGGLEIGELIGVEPDIALLVGEKILAFGDKKLFSCV